MEHKKSLRYAVIAAWITLLASKVNPIIANSSDVEAAVGEGGILTGIIIKLKMYFVPGYGRDFFWLLLLALGYYMFLKKIHKKIVPSCVVAAVIFSICCLLGKSYSILGNWDLVFYNKFRFFLSLIEGVGYTLLFYAGIETLYYYLDALRNKEKMAWILKRPFLLSFVCMIICWSPYIICCLPGSLTGDSYIQLCYYYNIMDRSALFPWFVTLLLGGCLDLGRMFGSDNLGMIFFLSLQVLISAASFSYVMYVLKKFGVSKKYYIILLLFFSLFPLWPGMVITLDKNPIYIALTTLYTALMAEFLFMNHNNQSVPLNKIIMCGIVILLCMLFRNNGVFIVIFSIPFLLLAIRKRHFRITMGTVVAAALLLFTLFNNWLTPAMGVRGGGTQAALSIPFQQTARYLKYHGDDVTEEEENILREMFFFYDELPSRYTPTVSDPIKECYHYCIPTEDTKESERELLFAYAGVWFHQFLRHPQVYFQATLHHNWGYYYPENKSEYVWFQEYQPMLDSDRFNIDYMYSFKEGKRVLMQLYFWVQQIPVISLLFCPGAYFWLLVLGIAYVIKNRWKREMIVFIPAMVTYLVCLAGPQGGILRYILPLASMMPLLVWVMRKENIW